MYVCCTRAIFCAKHRLALALSTVQHVSVVLRCEHIDEHHDEAAPVVVEIITQGLYAVLTEKEGVSQDRAKKHKG